MKGAERGGPLSEWLSLSPVFSDLEWLLATGSGVDGNGPVVDGRSDKTSAKDFRSRGGTDESDDEGEWVWDGDSDSPWGGNGGEWPGDDDGEWPREGDGEWWGGNGESSWDRDSSGGELLPGGGKELPRGLRPDGVGMPRNSGGV